MASARVRYPDRARHALHAAAGGFQRRVWHRFGRLAGEIAEIDGRPECGVREIPAGRLSASQTESTVSIPSPMMSCAGSLTATSSMRLPDFEPRTFFAGNSSPVSGSLISALPFGRDRSSQVRVQRPEPAGRVDDRRQHCRPAVHHGRVDRAAGIVGHVGNTAQAAAWRQLQAP